MQHCDDEVLALVALGEEASFSDAAHLAACPDCQAEVESLRRVVGGVKVSVGDGPPVPPQSRVWDEIAAATGVSVTPRTVPADRSDHTGPTGGQTGGSAGGPSYGAGHAPAPSPIPEQSVTGDRQGQPAQFRRRRDAGARSSSGRSSSGRSGGARSLLLVAASALVVGAAGGVVGTRVLTPDPATPKPKVVTQVVLAALPVDPQAKGEAKVVSTGNGRELAVDVSRLAGTDGFYEVWLIDRGVKKMIPLGILHGDRGEFAIPPGVDLGQYPIVDVSAEPLDGNPQHSGKSLLRGTIEG